MATNITEESFAAPATGIWQRSWKWLAALLALLIVGAMVMLVALNRDPGGDSVEAGFLRDMMPHHDQAVEMALIIRDRTEDEQLYFTATDILLTQQNQIGMMGGWLDLWDLSPNQNGPMMAWMDHPIEEGLMPGIATSEEIDRLRSLPVEEAEILFLQLMIRHHQGGVEMGEAYLERGDQEEVTEFAESLVRVQNLEIETMNMMLEQRGQEPITGSPGMHEGH